MAKNYLVLEDGAVYEGEAFGYPSDAFGEVVFATGMNGYQDSLTDPSYQGQILVLTLPLIGNYGINDAFNESDRVHVRALAVSEYCREPSDMYGGKTLDEFLRDNKVPGISGIDTRDLVIRIRQHGTLKGKITSDPDEVPGLAEKLRQAPMPSEANLVAEVGCREIERFDGGKDLTVGMIDLGEKGSILKNLRARFNVIMFPYDTPADVITESGVKGVLISNGPGDPSQPMILKHTARTVSDLSTQLPLFGICFGNQITALALGAKTYKLKFGHHGCNQPVMYDGRVYITSQNHNFAVDEASLAGTGLIADQFNVNDRTVEGMRHKDLPIFTCQYHPEASPGPWDTTFLFDRFASVVREGRL